MDSDSTAPTIGLLGLHVSKESKAILNAAEALGFETEWIRRENAAISVTDGEVAFEPTADIICNRLLLSTSAQPAEELGLARILEELRPMLNPPASVLTAMHKYATAVTLAQNGISVPDTLLALSGSRLNAEREQFGKQAVYKTAIGTHGGGAWRVSLDKPVNPQVGERQAFLQEYIDQPGTQRDLRIYVVGDRIIGAIYRYAPEGDWRTNVSLGGDVEDATETLPKTAAKIARETVDVLGLDYAGVDLISDGDGWYVLEVNPTAGFRGLFKATGRNPAPYIVQLAAERLDSPVPDEEADKLAGTLDDSQPACIDEPRTVEPAKSSTIGYIEEVTVSGTRGSKTIYAKSDTGANRTSIDVQLAAEIGTGPIKNIVRIRSGSEKESKTRPVVDTVIGIGGRQHTVSASVEDREHMDYPLLLGRDILEAYQVDVKRQADRGTQEVETEE